MSSAIDLSRVAESRMGALSGPQERVFALALFASLVIHAALIALGPTLRRIDEKPPRPLEVALVRPPVPEPMKPPRAIPKPPPVPQPPVRTQTQPVARQPLPKPVSEQRQILALPESAPSTPSTFSVPQTPVEPGPPAPEPKVAPAPAAPSAPAREVASTPASFNAAYLRNAPPRYPLIARRNGVEGTVRLKVLVSREGKPAQVQLDQSSGSAALDSAALEAVRGWQFVPARRGQESIESWVLVPVVFKLEGTS